MYHALEIQEIFLNILGHCLRRGYAASGTSCLVALARTCRSFKEPALDVLWEDLVDLSPLVRSISGAYRISTEWHFCRRPLTDADWAVLRSYARRIRQLRDVEPRVGKSTLMTLLSPPTPEPFFPNLRCLRSLPSFEFVSLSHLSLPSLTSLFLDFDNAYKFQDYLDSIPKLCPNLRQLTLYVDELGVNAMPNEFDCDYFRLWQNLHIVVCHKVSLDLDSLRLLSRMPTLTHLTFMLCDTLPASNSILHFSNLCSLSVYSQSLEPILDFLKRGRLPVVTDVTIYSGSRPSTQDLSSFTTSTNGVLTIETLRLTQSSIDGGLDIPILGFNNLRPWMAFHNLRCLHIDIDWNVCLSGNDLLLSAFSWPRLEELSINPHWGWNLQTGITPDGLLKLLQTCRSLTKLALAIDTQGYTELSPSVETHGLTLSPTFSINVVDSAIEEESIPALTAFFAHIMPGPRFTMMAWAGPGSRIASSVPLETYRDRWYDVYRRVREVVTQHR